MQWSLLVAVLALAGRASATLSVQDGKFSIVDAVSASVISSDSFSSDSSSALTGEDRKPLTETDVIKLAFTVTRDGQPFQPQQASLVVVNSLHPSRRTAQFPIKVRPNSGKAKWDSHSDPRIHSQLASLATAASDTDTTTVGLTLVVGHPHEPEPLQLDLGRIQLPPQSSDPDPPTSLLPKHWQAEKYAPQPEIVWTFRDGEKPVHPLVALVGLAVVLAPWIVLLATVPRLLPNGRFPIPSGTTTLFLLSLVALESLSVISWVYFLPVLHTLPYWAAIAAMSVLTGRRALGEMAHARKTRAAAAAAAERKQL